jgi:hypothetical protein
MDVESVQLYGLLLCHYFHTIFEVEHDLADTLNRSGVQECNPEPLVVSKSVGT